MAGLGEVTGSVPDVVSMALGISDAMAPDKGFAYNLCTFQINLANDQQDNPSESKQGSASVPSPSGDKASSATSANNSKNLVSRPGPVIFAVKMGSVGEGVKTVIEVGIREFASRDRIAGVVELRKLEGFDTSLFDNLSIEISVQDQQIVPNGVLLTVKGLINPTGIGFSHFIGSVLVVAQGSGFTCKPQFITQAPPRSSGKGIFGKVIECSAIDYLSVWAYNAPFGG